MHLNARHTFWLFGAGKCFYQRRGLAGDIGRCLAPTLLGSFGKLYGSLPREIPSSCAQDEEQINCSRDL